MAGNKAWLVDQVKSFQKKGPVQKQSWYDFIASQGSTDKDPNRHEENVLEEFLASAEAGNFSSGTSTGGGGGGNASAELVEQVKSYQRQGPEQKQAWYSFLINQGFRDKDPARHDEHVLAQFLSGVESGEISVVADADGGGKAELVERVKAYQRQGPEFKQEWYNFIALQRTGDKDPARYDEHVLGEFLASHETGTQVSSGGSSGKSFGGNGGNDSSGTNPMMMAMMQMMCSFMKGAKEGGKGRSSPF